MSLIPILPDEQRNGLMAAYNRVLVQKRRQGFLILAVLSGLCLAAGIQAEVRLDTFFANIWRFTSYLGRILPDFSLTDPITSLSNWFWNFPHWMELLFQTILMAYLGTFIGAILAVPLCFLAASNINRHQTLRFVIKRMLELLRTTPGMVFALIFVIAFGLGPIPGVLAVALHSTGALAKLFSEVVENIDMKPVDGVAAAGGGWLARIRFAVLPQVLPGFASYTLLRFEINVRESSVLGFVGAGGIGEDLVTSIRQFYYSDVSALLLIIILTVVAIDFGTEKLRHRLIGSGGRA